MSGNARFFPGGKPSQQVLLTARGFDRTGNRSGGIKALGMQVVTIPKGTTLLRIYSQAGRLGDWWFTPHEYRRVRNYFAVDGATLAVGRAQGALAFHGVLALLGEWYGNSPDQIGRFYVAITQEPLLACYGEGDVATSSDWSRTLKPVAIDRVGGVARGARQLYIPETREYSEAFALIPPANDLVDTGLDAAVAAIAQDRLAFE